MAKYLLLKHYRGAPTPVNDVPMDQWTPEELSAHVQYMQDFAARLEGTGEFVDGQALSSEGTFVRYDGEGRPPVTDGPFAETKELIAGFTMIQVTSREEAIAWVKKWPREDGDVELELRQVFDADDFGDALTPELRDQEERMRTRTSGKA